MIDYTDRALYEDNATMQEQNDKEFYTPEEVYESIMSDVKVIYELKDAV